MYFVQWDEYCVSKLNLCNWEPQVGGERMWGINLQVLYKAEGEMPQGESS